MSNASRPPTPTPKEPANQSQWRFEPLNVPTEWIESYRPGGFHPIHPGDTLGDSRYTIICKLGYGAFSTVWLADDNKYDRRTGPLLWQP
jgi:serine/threonine protein kinase